MDKIKVSELFYSIQGEGRFMGVPSVFLRTFGCNFKCQGFGMPKGELSKERDAIIPANYKELKELPLVTTGCDSYASWDPNFKHLSPFVDIPDLASRIVDLLPGGGWRDEHLVITGGEPLLGWQKAYVDLLQQDSMDGLDNLTFETNGTQMIGDELSDYLRYWTDYEKCYRTYQDLTFSVSPKLSCSGEAWDDAIKPEVVAQYDRLGYTYLKFVVSTEDDVQEAEKAVLEYRKAGFTGVVYLMPVGGVESVYSLNKRQVADMALKRGWRYSDRLHVALFKNQWNT